MSAIFLQIFLSILMIISGVNEHAFAFSGESTFEIMPWRVGQYVTYKITTMEGEGLNNRYKITIVGEEEVDDKKYFWVQIDVYEEYFNYGYNTVRERLKKNVSFMELIPPLDTSTFAADPAKVISSGFFPNQAIKFSVQFDDNRWHNLDPSSFFSYQDVIEDTPYSLTPHAKGKINFRKLKIDNQPHIIRSPRGEISCYHFYVDTDIDEDYWDEGFDLWRSADVPILGMVKMEFSKTKYWQKWEHNNELQAKKGWLGILSNLYKKRVPGRRHPDTCTILLIDYGV